MVKLGYLSLMFLISNKSFNPSPFGEKPSGIVIGQSSFIETVTANLTELSHPESTSNRVA